MSYQLIPLSIKYFEESEFWGQEIQEGETIFFQKIFPLDNFLCDFSDFFLKLLDRTIFSICGSTLFFVYSLVIDEF